MVVIANLIVVKFCAVENPPPDPAEQIPSDVRLVLVNGSARTVTPLRPGEYFLHATKEDGLQLGTQFSPAAAARLRVTTPGDAAFMVLRTDVEMFAHFRRQNFGNDSIVFPAGEEISPVGISFLSRRSFVSGRRRHRAPSRTERLNGASAVTA